MYIFLHKAPCFIGSSVRQGDAGPSVDRVFSGDSFLSDMVLNLVVEKDCGSYDPILAFRLACQFSCRE